MATRYLVAMDYVDLHAKKVMKKYAQNRPLGEIEKKYHYALPQPMLSCHLANSTSGSQKYRPKSSAQVIQGQQKSIHDLYSRSRKARSAPATRRVNLDDSGSMTDDYPPHPRINVSVQGRPATSSSVTTTQQSGRRCGSVNRRYKTTGYRYLKKSEPVREMMVVKVDPDILMSSRRRKELTNQIREQWNSENHDLSNGQFVRGSGSSVGLTPLDSPRPCGQWLTFGGSNKPDSEGVVDAFVSLNAEGHSYSIDGYSGSRVAQQLQKGGRIRIGVNGAVGIAKESPRPDEDRNVSVSENEILKPVPLCWTDQVYSHDAKVLRPRSPPKESPKPNLCETHPVIFKKLLNTPMLRVPTTAPGAVASVTYKKPQTTLLTLDPVPQLITGTSGHRSFQNIGVTPLESGILSRNEEHNTSVISMSVRDSKHDDKSSSTESYPQINAPRPKSAFDKKTTKLTSRRDSQHECGSQHKSVRVKPSPASFHVHTRPDPELRINVSGTKAEIGSPKISSPIISKKDFFTNGKMDVRHSASASTNKASSPQPEFIHFTTGLVNPNITAKRRSKSAGTGTPSSQTPAITEPMHREVSFDPSSTGEPSAQTSTKDVDSNATDIPKRTNTPVSPEPPRDNLPPSPDLSHESFAFSIPTAYSDGGQPVKGPLSGYKSPSMSEDRTSQSDGIKEELDGQEEPEVSPSDLPLTTSTQYDPQFGEITALMKESMTVTNHSDSSSSQSDSSVSHQNGEEQFDQSSRTNCSKQRVRFECDAIIPENYNMAAVSAKVDSPKIGDLVSNQIQPDVLDATTEVKRLRQQIRNDLLKQQSDTEDDIQYLRLRHDQHIT